jgi:hypothetical protein
MKFLLANILLMTPSVLGAPIISFPNTTAFTGATNQTFDVVISNPSAAPGAGEPITDYTFSFNVVPEAGATGTVTLTGDWAITPPNALLPTNPGEGVGSTPYFVTDFVNSTPVALDNGKNLFRGVYNVSPNASGVFDLVVFHPGTQTGLDSRFRFDNGIAAPTFVPVAFGNGTITVVAPEPAMVGLLLPLLVVSRRRRQA